MFFFFSSRRRHTRCSRDWSSDVCSSDLHVERKRRTEREGSDPPEGAGTDETKTATRLMHGAWTVVGDGRVHFPAGRQTLAHVPEHRLDSAGHRIIELSGVENLHVRP